MGMLLNNITNFRFLFLTFIKISLWRSMNFGDLKGMVKYGILRLIVCPYEELS